MKKYLLVISLFSFLFGKDKYQFFLTSDENLKLVGENYDIIKTELDKMFADYESKIDLGSDFHKIIYQETVFTGPVQRDLESINRQLEGYMENGFKGVPFNSLSVYEKKAIMDRVEAKYTGRPSKTVTKERNRTIERGETLSTKEGEWSDVVSYYGGYSELSKLGISKDDKSKFDISVVLEKIELTGPSNCLAHVKINGDDDALKFHKIPKSTFKYKGTYKIKYDDDYLALYDGGNIRLDLRFDEKKYLPKSKTEFKINLNKSILPSTKNYRNSIIVMFDDLAPESIYIDNSPKFESFRKEYKQAFEMEYQSDLNKLSLEKMKEKLNNFNKMKARQALRESEQLKYKNFQKEYYKQGFKACGVTCAILAIGLINSAVQGY
ncbi:MAG: hypothetical protein HOI55_04105 [Candidatus Marinimicrobia bacterium]|nr:hypothetical protein [Candidatus Neomarinimicrobiota bacterium]